MEVLGSLALALPPSSAISGAAAESPLPYVVAGLAATASLTCVWFLRHRTRPAIAILIGWPIATYLLLSGRTTPLGRAYYGELIAYHFVGFVCAALASLVLYRWASSYVHLGRRRHVPVAVGLPGSACLLLAHVGTLPGWDWAGFQPLHTVGAALLLSVWPLSLVLFWPELRHSRVRWLAPVLLVPWSVRVVLGGPGGISGAAISPSTTWLLGSSIIASAVWLMLVYQPRTRLWVRILVAFVSVIIGGALQRHYEIWYGRLDDLLGGLTRSFFGFTPPYPAYAESFIAPMTLAVIFILTTVITSLISTRDRPIGIALALLTLGGLGLASPHLVLLAGAGAIMLIDGGLDDAPSPANTTPARGAFLPLATSLAEGLGFETPVSLDSDGTAVVAMHGRHLGHRVELRARAQAHQWRVELTVGLPGRETADVQLMPARRGATRLGHPAGRTHKVVGNQRALEPFGDALLTAFADMKNARLGIWAGGVQLWVTGPTVVLDPDALERFIRSACDGLSTSS